MVQRRNRLRHSHHYRGSDRGVVDGRRTVRAGAAGVWTVGGCDEE